MEELLPLIIGIVWLLYSFYNKRKKGKSRKQSPAPSQTSRKQPSIIEQLFAGEGIQLSEPEPEIYEENENFELSEEPVFKVPEKKEPKPFLHEELSGFKGEGNSGLKFEIQGIEENLNEDVFETELTEDIEDFNLRKAVVYSAILNAPYIDYK